MPSVSRWRSRSATNTCTTLDFSAVARNGNTMCVAFSGSKGCPATTMPLCCCATAVSNTVNTGASSASILKTA